MLKSGFIKKIVFLAVCLILLSSIVLVAQAAGTPTLTVSNSSVPVNGAVDVSVSNAQNPTNLNDWVGLYESTVTPGGGQPAIWWDYVLNLGVTAGNGTFTFNPSNISSGQASRFTSGKAYKFILAYNDSYTVAASVNFNATASQNPTIASFNEVIVNTNAGTAPQLPSTVTANYSNGSSGTVSVIWNSISSALYSQAGSFTVKGYVATTGVVPKASVTVKEGSGPVLSFQVISDVHISNTSSTDISNLHLGTALKDMRQINPNGDALVVVGDITDGGNSTQYDTLNSILQSVPHSNTYFAMGNHDTWQSDFNTARTNFLTKTGMPGVYYDTWIKGYHFIILGSEALNGNVAVISDTQLNWFQQKLSENASLNKPIFVFLHQPLADTVAGSEIMKDVQQDQQIKNILTQYPQTVLMTGHTHEVATSPTEFYNAQYCNMVNTVSVSYLWYTPTNSQPGNGSQGLYIDVYPNKVVVKCREYTQNEWIAQKTFMYDGTTTTLFKSGLETSDTQPTWADTVDSTGGGIKNVTGYFSGINPECSIRAIPGTNERVHTGTRALMFSGTDNSATQSYCYYKAFDVNIPVSASTKLSYWLYPEVANARFVSIDLVCTDGTTLRDAGVLDQNGTNMHPNAGRGTVGQWNYFQGVIGSKLNGKIIDRIMIGYDQPGGTGQYRGQIDDISITN